MAKRNPFTPAFGTMPAIVAGRNDLLDEMAAAFEEGPGNPHLSTILIGARGTGKTVCMACICDEALQSGWLCVRSTARNGMLEDIYEQLARVAADHLAAAALSLTSVKVGPVAIGLAKREHAEANWRTRMEEMLDRLAENDIGVVISIDEVRGSEPEMVELAAVFQLFVVEGRKVALVMAGLPFHVHQLLNDESVSFLRRSMQYQLGRIADSDVRAALQETFEGAGRCIGDDALDICVAAAQGFAYMIQLVGYRTWREARGDTVHPEEALRGIRAAHEDMEEHVFRATYRELSDGDIAFLRAMLPDKEESRLAHVARRMNVKSNYASKYKSRLLAQGVIETQDRNNMFAFAMPGFREFLERELEE